MAIDPTGQNAYHTSTYVCVCVCVCGLLLPNDKCNARSRCGYTECIMESLLFTISRKELKIESKGRNTCIHNATMDQFV